MKLEARASEPAARGTRTAVRGGAAGSPRPGRVPSLVLDRVAGRDCVAGMRALPAASFDLAICDPPYNLSAGGRWAWEGSPGAAALPGFGGAWEKVRESWDVHSLDSYLGFTISWLSEVKRLVRPTGSLWVHGTYHNLGIVNVALQALGIEILNEVVWYKRNSFPNLSGRRLTASHETILWAHTGKKREYFFDYALSRTFSCPGDRLRAEGKQMRTVWDIPNNKSKDELAHGRHPTQKPLRLLERMIRLTARPGQACLVPFAGAGSECVAAKRAGLRYLGFETDPAYARIARARLRAAGGGPEAAP